MDITRDLDDKQPVFVKDVNNETELMFPVDQYFSWDVAESSTILCSGVNNKLDISKYHTLI